MYYIYVAATGTLTLSFNMVLASVLIIMRTTGTTVELSEVKCYLTSTKDWLSSCQYNASGWGMVLGTWYVISDVAL